MKDKSEKRANEILSYFTKEIIRDFSIYLEGLILVGSLTNGSYVEGPGRDIDIITVFNDGTPKDIKQQYLDRVELIENKFNKDIPISKDVFYLKDLIKPYEDDIELILKNHSLVEVPVILLRIHESGKVLFGDGILDKLKIPTKEEYFKFDILTEKLRNRILETDENYRRIYTDMLDNPTIRIAIQVIITRAFRHYYYSTGKVCCNKHYISKLMKEDVPNYKYNNLLELATKFKMYPNNNYSKGNINVLLNGMKGLMEWSKKHSVGEIPYLDD